MDNFFAIFALGAVYIPFLVTALYLIKTNHPRFALLVLLITTFINIHVGK